MANVIINDTNLTNIANAIREKNGETTKYKPSEMANAILAISATGDSTEIVPTKAYTLTGTASYYDYDGCWDWFIESVGNKIKCKDLTDGTNMFQNCGLTSIPFDLTFSEDTATFGRGNSVQNLFDGAENLKEIKSITINNPEDMSMMFRGCHNLREIPLSIESFSRMNEGKAYSKSSNIFAECYSLRSLPNNIAYRMYDPNKFGNILTYDCIRYCYSLDEITNIRIGVLGEGGTYGNNYFGDRQPFLNCCRLKNITFNSPQSTTLFNQQHLNITGNVGYVKDTSVGKENENCIINYNSGITAEKRVYNDETYQALKNDPDWYATKIEYSRYNKISAKATINSLPDASGGVNNVITFEGNSGELTDGGAINTMTEEEIAVAVAKGWTVSYV